jgi:thiol-disulfide isomerase/thioredoxin
MFTFPGGFFMKNSHFNPEIMPQAGSSVRSATGVVNIVLGGLLLFAPGLARTPVQITGAVSGTDGNPPVLAHVHLTPATGELSDPWQSVQVAPDGGFHLSLDSIGVYRLWITAVNHRPLDIPIILEPEDSSLSLKVRLSPYRYREKFDEVKIIGSWKRYRPRSADVMQRREDGTYAYTVEVKADTVGYQLLGLETTGRSINGPLAEYYVYDGGGDYRSVLQVQPGPVEIVFDPGQLLRTTGSLRPEVTFDERHPSLQRIFELYRAYRAVKDRLGEEIAKYRSQHDDLEGFVFTAPELQARLIDHMRNDEEIRVRRFAALCLARLSILGGVTDEAVYPAILDTLGAASPLWGLFPLTIDHTLQEAYYYWRSRWLRELERRNPDRVVRAQALASIVMSKFLFKELDRPGHGGFDSLYHELETKYNDVKDVRYIIRSLKPEKHITVGAPVPEFQVTLLDSDRTVSDKSLRGRYVLLDFWAVWCQPCVREMPILHDAFQQYKDRNFIILSLSFDRTPEDVRRFRIDKWAMPWLHAFIEDGFNSDLAKDFEVWGIPRPVLISPEGMILAVDGDLRGDRLLTTLKQYLGEKRGVLE